MRKTKKEMLMEVVREPKKEYGQHTLVSGTSARRVGIDFFV